MDPRAETHLRLLTEARLRQAVTAPHHIHLDEDFAIGGQPPREESIYKVAAVAQALELVGAVSPAAAARVISEFTAALAARAIEDPGGLAPGRPRRGSDEPATDGSREPGAVGEHVRAVPVGVALPVHTAERQGRLHLLTLATGPGRAALTAFFAPARPGQTPGRAPRPGEAETRPGSSLFGIRGASDERGRRYELRPAHGEGGFEDVFVLDLVPVPPGDIRWLEVVAGPGTPPARVRVPPDGGTWVEPVADPAPAAGPAPEPNGPADPASRPAGVASGHVHATASPAEPGPSPERPVLRTGIPTPAGELLLDVVAQALLGGGPMTGIGARLLAFGLTEVVTALEAVGALHPDSLATAHVAALCQHCGFGVGPALAARAGTTRLPAHWASVLEHRGRQDGPDDAAPVAAVLPRIEGARFALAGLRSTGRLSVIPVLAWGWRPFPRRFRRDQPLSWWARDSAGRWHVGRPWPAAHAGHALAGNPPAPGRASVFGLELLPALDPTATSLDVFVTGASSTVSVTVPLAWQAPGRGGTAGRRQSR